MHKFFVVLTIFSAIGFFVSGVDDFFIDAYYWLRRWYRAIFLRKKLRRVSEADLAGVPEKWVAIWIPAWNEDGVVDKMLLNTIESVHYRNYDIFVGTYPNDEPTQLAVESVHERYGFVHKVVCPNAGPTNKADCLNWVFQGILLEEERKGIRYEIVVLHDSEDIVHPLELQLFNWLIPRKDMVQLPVIPMEMPATHLTAGTYLDEFAENHSKDLLVRELLCSVIPSAGVGTGLSRVFLDELSAQRQNRIFNTNSLTEDYEFGFGLLSLKRRGILAQFSILRTQTNVRGWWHKRQEMRSVQERVAVREFFPDTFRLAVRQKSRWVLGITLQGWKHLGWQGNFWVKYMLYRDRKTLITNVINLSGYVVVLYWLITVVWFRERHYLWLVKSGWQWDLVVADTVIMFHRLAQRVVAVRQIAGWKQSLLSIPRLALGNAINFVATAVAVAQFFTAERTGKRTAWQKTAHVFPSAEQLKLYRHRLGDLLLENRLVTVAQLREGLAQQHSGEKLGEVLTRLGYVSEEDLLTVLGRQLRVSVCSIDHRLIDRKLLQAFPRQLAEELLVLPLRTRDGVIEVACRNPGDAELKARVETTLGSAIVLQLATETDLRFAISRAYVAEGSTAGLPLGELLVKAGAITATDLDRALRQQKHSGRKLGEVLQDLGLVSAEILTASLHEQQKAARGSSQGDGAKQ